MGFAPDIDEADSQIQAGGHSLRLRSVSPSDADLFRTAFEHLTRDEVVSRFFVPIRTIDHMLGSLTATNTGEHVAFVLLDETPGLGDANIHGVARMVIDDTGQRAEFAIIIDRALYGHGIGEQLIRRLARHAARSGVAEIYGEVLSQNRRMVRLCRRLGFESRRDPSDASIIRFTIRSDALAD